MMIMIVSILCVCNIDCWLVVFRNLVLNVDIMGLNYFG